MPSVTAPPTTDPEPPADTPVYRRWLHRFSFVVLAATFALVAIGGHVTSTESGMAVPDGWFTFGWWSLFAPPSLWWNQFGTFWEHTHRLQGNVVGLLTIVVAVWLVLAHTDWVQLKSDINRRGFFSTYFRFRFLKASTRPYLRWAGYGMLLLVCIQGAMGAFRVDENSITLAFVHGISGQMILCLWVLVAAALSKPWVERVAEIRQRRASRAPRKLRWFTLAMLAALFVQLTLGAAVRHYKADKSLPDFPLHYSQVLPPMSQDALDEAYLAYHAERFGLTTEEATAAGWSNRSPRNNTVVVPVWKVHLQFAHRVWAYTLLIAGITLVVMTLRSRLDQRLLLTPALLLLSLFVLQVSLGAITVMTETDVFAATMHQATGALLIATATWLAVRVHLAGYRPAHGSESAEADRPQPACTPTAAPPPPRTTPSPA